MKKWKLYLHCTIITSCFIALFGVFWWALGQLPDPSVRVAHIYLDSSSFPTLLQMMDVVKNRNKEPKLISWQRMTDITAKNSILKNAVVLPHVPYHLREYWERLEHDLRHFVSQYPNAQFVVHLNKDQNRLVWLTLRLVPKQRIKELHLYEESFAHTTYQTSPIFHSTQEAQRVLANHIPPKHFDPNLALSLLPLYPQTTVHLALPELALENKNVQQLRYAQRLEEVDFVKISKQLTKEQKQDLLTLNEITPDMLRPFQSGKPTMLYTLTFMFGKRPEDEKQLDVLRKIFAKKSQWIKDPDQYTWLYKEHPWHARDTFLHDTISATWPSMHALPKQVPLEVFLLTGYMPDKVFGYSSALFFALPADRILFFIRRPENDPYIPVLKKMKKITDKQIVKLEDFHV